MKNGVLHVRQYSAVFTFLYVDMFMPIHKYSTLLKKYTMNIKALSKLMGMKKRVVRKVPTLQSYN